MKYTLLKIFYIKFAYITIRFIALSYIDKEFMLMNELSYLA